MRTARVRSVCGWAVVSILLGSAAAVAANDAKTQGSQAASPPMMDKSARRDAPPWIRVSKEALGGQKIPVVEGAESALPGKYFDTDAPANPRYAMVHSDRMETFIFDTTASVSKSYDFPGDEIVNVRSGEMIIADEATGETHTFKPGSYFILPKHWRGVWTFKSVGGQPSREFSQVSAGQWSNTQAPLDRAAVKPGKSPSVIPVDLESLGSKVKPMSFESPATSPAGDSALLGHVIFTGMPSFLLLDSPKGASYDRGASNCDTVVRLLKGSVVLEDAHKKETFNADDVFVLTRTFQGKVHLSPGFRGLSILAASTQSATVPKDPVPTVKTCPAI